MYQYDLQPTEENSIGEYLDNATKTEPNPIRNAQGHFEILKNGYTKYYKQTDWGRLYGCKVEKTNLQKVINSLPDHEKVISRPYPDHQNGGFSVSWICLTFCFFKMAVTALKKTSSGITWSLLSLKLNSPGGIRTCDQSINSRSLYRWATEEYIKI